MTYLPLVWSWSAKQAAALGAARRPWRSLCITSHPVDRGAMAPVQKPKLTMRRRLPKPLVGSCVFARLAILSLLIQLLGELGVDGLRPYSELVSERRGRRRRETKEQVLPNLSISWVDLDLDLRTTFTSTSLDLQTVLQQHPNLNQASS